MGEEIGTNIGNYIVEQGISKRRIRIQAMGNEGLEEWEKGRLVTKVYSLPLEPPQEIVLQKPGILRKVTFDRDGELTEEGESRLRVLSIQMEKYDFNLEIITRSNRSKETEQNLILSKNLGAKYSKLWCGSMFSNPLFS